MLWLDARRIACGLDLLAPPSTNVLYRLAGIYGNLQMLHGVNTLLPAHIQAVQELSALDQLFILQTSSYILLAGLMLLSVMLYGGDNPRLIHATVASLSVVDVALWASMLWVIGYHSGTLSTDGKGPVGLMDLWVSPVVEGVRACFIRGEATSQMYMVFGGSGTTFAIKVGYLLGLFGKDRIVDEKLKKRNM